jgi:cell division septal protein FtsQ
MTISDKSAIINLSDMSLFSKKQPDLPRRRMTGDNLNTPITQSDNSFRRNRTLTGIVSPNLESPRSHVHHLTIRRRKVLSILSVVFVASVLLWTLIINFTAMAVVTVSDVSLSKSIDNKVYEKAIEEYLDINPIERLHFFLNESALNNFVFRKLPEVADISQRNMVVIGKTEFVITMRKPIAGWVINNKQSYVDSKGVPFEKNYFANPTVQIVDNSGASPTKGVAIASNRFLGFVGRVVASVSQNGYTVTQATLPLNTTRELEIKLKEVNFAIRLSIDRSVGEQIEDMARAVKYFVGQGQSPEYIDIRVSGKAFYK